MQYEPDGDGIACWEVQEIDQGVQHGLSAQFHGNQCTWLVRFEKGKAVGKWLIWDYDGNLVLLAEFKQSYDFLKNQRSIRLGRRK